MIRAMRRSVASTSTQEPSSIRSQRSTRSSTRGKAPRRNRTSSLVFSRRSLGLSSTLSRSSRRTTEATDEPVRQPPLAHADSTISASNSIAGPRTFDPLALVRRLPATVRSFGYVKTARNLAVFSRFERYWLELRGTIVVLIVDDEVYRAQTHSSQRARDNVIAGVFAVHKCHVVRSRSSKSAVIRLVKPGHSQNIWLRFEDEADCDIWEKALIVAASQRAVGISDFEFISPIGKGASGKVFLVTDRKTGDKLALKVIDKAKVFESRSGFRHALDERLALEMVDGHPFFSRLRYAFQTRAFFYLAIDFYDGGDLYQYLRTHQGRLRETQVRSVSAEVALALEHLHKLGFIYRDLKPENVLLDSKGHVRLADFGLCKLVPNKALTNTICGTHTYAAPEMLAVRNYGKSIDLWAFGVFVYHILRGRTPYEARDLDQVIANMNNRRIRFSSNTSPELVSMIKKLLDWNPETRLGCGTAGMIEVRGHSFFAGIDWKKVYMRDNDEGGLFAKPKRPLSSIGHNRLKRPPKGTVPPPPPPSPAHLGPKSNTCAAAHDANESGETPSTQVLMREKSADSGDSGKAGSGSKASGSERTGAPDSKTGDISSQDAYAQGGISTGTESDEIETTNRLSAKARRMFRPKSLGHLNGNRPGTTRANQRFSRVVSEQEQSPSVSLREKMAAAAEQDDLRNFDMSEWGKISVDNDHDDANYGDASLWPISRAKRRLVEDERVIAGFSYCSSSKPFVVPDNL